MIDLLLTAIILLAASAMGRIGIQLLALKTGDRLEMMIFQIALGWVGLSMSFFILGVSGWLRIESVWGLILLLTILGIWFQCEWLRPRTWSRCKLPTLRYLEWIVLLPTVALYLAILLLALAPPRGDGMGWDGLAYHLPAIKAFIQRGQIIHQPEDRLTFAYPMGMNILFTPGLMFGHAVVAQLIHFSMGLLAALAIAVLASRYANRTVTLLLPGLFFAIPVVQKEATWPMVDLGVTLYTCLALLALINWWETEQKSWLVIAGITAGFACSIKMTAVFGVVAISLLLLSLIVVKYRRQLSHWIDPILIFGIPLLLVGTPWYIKNYLLVGNPFMPYFYNIFGGAHLTPQAYERYMLYLTSLGLQVPFSVLLIMSISCWLGAIFFALKTKGHPVVKILLAYTLLWVSLWFVSSSPQQRFLLPAYPVALLLMAWFVSSFTRRLAVLHTALYGAVALILVLSLGKAVWANRDVLTVGLGLESQEDFLNRKLYSYSAFQFANTQLPNSAKFLIFPENRTFYLDRSYILGDPYGIGMIDYAPYHSPNELLKGLESLEITHLILLHPAYPFWRQLGKHDPQLTAYADHAFELVDGLANLGLQEVFEANGVTIYALPDTRHTQQDNP
jgi:hypothetical protein